MILRRFQGKVHTPKYFKEVYVGSPSLLKELNVQFDDKRIFAASGRRQNRCFHRVADGKLIGAFALADKVRDESREAS